MSCSIRYNRAMVSAISDRLPIARFSVDQYHRMIASGAFTEDDRLELIDGWVVTQMAKGPGHEFAVGRTDELLRDGIPPGWHVRNQTPITLVSSEPEPDVVIVRGDRSAYRQRHPHASEIALVVEVSDSSLGTDRVKGKMYGSAGIPVYWLVNLVDRCVEVHTQPDPADDSGYASRRIYRVGDAVPLEVDAVPCRAVPVVELMP